MPGTLEGKPLMIRFAGILVGAALVAGCATQAMGPSPLTPAPSARQLALRRPISNTNPMFIFRGEPQYVADVIPAELRPYVAVELFTEVTSPDAGDRYDKFLTACDSLKIYAFTQVWNGWTPTTIDTSWIESMFKKHPYYLGPLFAELHGSHYDYVASCIDISSRYGGYALNDEYLNGENHMLLNHSSPALLAAMRAHPDNYIIVTKQTTPAEYLKGEAISAGLWICGLAGNWGINPDSWSWWETGRGKLFGPEGDSREFDPAKCWVTYPEAQVSMALYEAAIAGATVFAIFEHPSYEVAQEGTLTPCFRKEILPTLKKIVSDRLIPDRDQVRKKTKVASVHQESPKRQYGLI